MRARKRVKNQDSPEGCPPLLAEKFLRICLPRGIASESILGDLREEYASDLRSESPLRAKLLYLRRASSIALRFVRMPHPQRSEPKANHRALGETMSGLIHDVRQAFRLLVRKPALTLAAIVSLGLGIGASTGIFSLVNTIVLKPLPYPESEALVEAFRIDKAVTGLDPAADRVSGLWAVPYEVHGDWLEMGRVFEAGGGYAGNMVSLQNGDGNNSLVALRMTSGAFEALRVEPELGRRFLPEDDEVGAPPVAVLSYGLWQSLFGGDPAVLGTQLQLDDVAHTVTGIMPRGFTFPSDTYQLWISFSDDQKTSPVRNGGYMKVVARLAPGVSLEQARRDMEGVSARIGELHPEEAEHRVGLFYQKDMIVGDTGAGLLILLGAVVLVLLIACTNVAGLFLIRATERRREIGVRRALGAGQGRLLTQQMAESTLLALVGGAVGWGLAVVGLDPVLSLMPSELPRLGEMAVNRDLLIIAVGFAIFTGILTGLLPAVHAARTPITSVLKEGGRSLSGGRARNRTQMSLVVSQIALAFVLLSGAGLVIRSLAGLLKVDTGFDAENLALANVSFPSGVEEWDDAVLYFQDLEDRIRAIPGVLDVAGADQMPFSGGWSSPPVTIETTEGVRDGILNLPTVTPSYFSTMDIPILAGRGFSHDDTPESEPVVVVSRAQASAMAPDGSPLGLRIRLNAPGDSIWRTVVGVVGDVKYRLDFSVMSMAYAPLAQAPSYMDNWVIRTASDPASLAPAFQRIREELDPEGTSSYRPLSQTIQGSTALVAARFSVILLGSLAALAAVLAVLGVYGVLAYIVQLRSRELGIQLALGAERRSVVRTILGRGLLMAGIGLATGTLLAISLGRLMANQLFGIEPWDPLSLASAAVLLLGATLAASYVPARRAAGLDPVEVLKGE